MKPTTWLGPSEAGDGERDELVSLADVTEIELLILKRMREFTIGEHRSLFSGSGFDFTGLRDWEAGDRVEHIDWPQSSLTNFSPLVVRDFEQPSTSSVVIVADRSASTRCGANGTAIAALVARAIATIGMSAVFFQDSIGLVVIDDRLRTAGGLRPRIGKGQVIRCLDVYQGRAPFHGPPGGRVPLHEAPDTLEATLAGFLRRTSMVPVVSDFLFDAVPDVVRGLARLNNRHDVFLAVVDASFAFALPEVSAGWVEAYDVETGRARVMSRREALTLGARVRQWQDEVARLAADTGLDVLRLEPDPGAFDLALGEFVIQRRLRKTRP